MKKRLSVGKRLAVMGTVLAVTGTFWGGQSVLAVDNADGTGNGVAIGTGSTATQSNAVAIGQNANVTGGSATAVGAGSQATGGFATAFGNSASATGAQGTAVGYQSVGAGAATAVGYQAKANQTGSIALGSGATTSGASNYMMAIAAGYQASASNAKAIALGGQAVASGNEGVAIGGSSSVTGNLAVAVGGGAKASGLKAISLGNLANASAESATAIGYQATAQKKDSIAIGNASVAGGTGNLTTMAIAVGYAAKATNNEAIAIGQSSTVSGNEGVAVGGGSSVTGNLSAALGANSAVSVINGTAVGHGANVSLANSVALGSNSVAESRTSFNTAAYLSGEKFSASQGVVSVGKADATRRIVNVAGGYDDTDAVNVAQLKAAINGSAGNKVDRGTGEGLSVGSNAITGSSNAVAISAPGNGTASQGSMLAAQATAGATTAVGSQSRASQAFATALGYSAKADGNSSLSLGYAANSSGTRAVALGSMSNAAGDDSFAMGNKAFANRKLSMAMGQNALANGTQSTVIGVSGETAVGAHNAIAMGYKSYVGAINADHPSVVTSTTVTTEPVDNKTSVSPIDGTVNYELSEDYYPVTTNDRTSTDPEKIYENSIALGMGAKSYGFQTLAIGGVAEAHDSNTIAVGLAAIAQGHYSVAMGQQARTSSNNALAIGHYAESHGEESTAIGYFSRVAGANNIALGNNTRLQGVNNSVALGSSARAQLNNSVAIGHNSAVLPDSSLTEAAYLTGEDYDLSHGAVSVGNIQYTVTAGNTSTTYLANTRRIMNVAGGYLDTDAVNVAQLKAALKDINIEAADGITVNRDGNKFTIGLNVAGVENPSNTVTITPSPSTGENPTNPTDPTDPTTLTEPTTPSYPNAGNPVQIGVDINPIAVGGDSGNANVTPGAAFNVVGGDNITTTASEVTVNGITVPKLEVALNKELTGLNSVSTNGLTIKGADGKDTVVIKGDNISMGNNIIHDVKAGVKDNDAVNVSQLRQEIQGETRVSAEGAFIKKDNTAAQNLTALDNQVQANSESISSINDSITNLNGGVSNLSNQVSKLDNRLDRVGAGAAALAALHPQDFDPSAKWDFAAGYGNYKGANAVALGAFYRPSNDVMFSVGTSMGGGENMFNAGVSIKFGSSNEYSNYSKSALAEVVSNQASTIENLNSRVAKQEQENQELRAQIQEILNQLASK